nr:acyl-CoA dehydrogenase family protein [Hyphomonas sp. 34-62-18]
MAMYLRGNDGSGSDAVTAHFRAEVIDFLDRELTPEMRMAGRATTGLKSARDACKEWAEKLYHRGWAAPLWPTAFGGAGWNDAQRLYFENACAERDAPIVQSSGVRTIGPLIISEGTPEQQARYLPKILSGDHEWCQGFSEPQAGSDLCALTLRANLDGDYFVLSGSKIWTSFASYATHMFLLARSDQESLGGAGLVFLLVELDRPGISIRPIRFIDGEAETNEVFFDQVRTPVNDRIGDIGDGWSTAKRLMAIARSNNTTTGLIRRSLRAALRSVRSVPDPDPALLLRLSDYSMRIDAFEMLENRIGSSDIPINAGAASSMLKLIATELHQAITEVGLDGDPDGDFALAKYFATRAASIYSGTSEIHRNILYRSLV